MVTVVENSDCRDSGRDVGVDCDSTILPWQPTMVWRREQPLRRCSLSVAKSYAAWRVYQTNKHKIISFVWSSANEIETGWLLYTHNPAPDRTSHCICARLLQNKTITFGILKSLASIISFFRKHMCNLCAWWPFEWTLSWNLIYKSLQIKWEIEIANE